MGKNPFKEIAEKSRETTNKKLANELARLTPITEEELKALLPTKEDKEHFAELMAIVKSASAENKKIAELGRSMERLGAVVVRVLDALV